MRSSEEIETIEEYNPSSHKFQYRAVGHIGSNLFRELVESQHLEKVLKINHRIEDGKKLTIGYL